MPGKRGLSKTKETELRFAVLDVLNNVDAALTIDQIKLSDMGLTFYTPQKLTRVLAYLIDMGLVRKAKKRSTGRMVYKAVCHLDPKSVDDADFLENPNKRKKVYHGLDWEAEEELREINLNTNVEEEDI